MMKPKKVFISSSLKNIGLNARIAELFERKGFKVYLPQRDTPQTDDVKTVFNANVNAIRESEIIVAVLINHGRDLGFEVGLAYGLGKPVIALTDNTDYLKDKMIAGALIDIAWNTEELLEKVIGYLNSKP